MCSKNRLGLFAAVSRYQDERSIDNLIGPPVGIQGEGQLTGALKRCPSAVVLLDEFEKAHPKGDVFCLHAIARLCCD